MPPRRFLASAVLSLRPLLSAPAVRMAAPDSPSARALVQRLQLAANLMADQQPAVRRATVSYVQALKARRGIRFASATDASAAYSAVEYDYARALQLVLGSGQMTAYQQLDADRDVAAKL